MSSLTQPSAVVTVAIYVILESGVQTGVNELGSSKNRGGLHSTVPEPKTSSWVLLPMQTVLSGEIDMGLL